MMHRACTGCGSDFEITDEDLAFYKKMSPSFGGTACQLPPPTDCPACRLRRRLAFINQITVYARTSSVSGKRMFSMFPNSAPFPVYENDYWWSDTWNALDYGKDPDFSVPFFQQHAELHRTVPRFALMVLNNEDCDYCNNVSMNKHCYLCFNTRRSEDCIRCERTIGCKNCLDCMDVSASERCYNCVACSQCYDLQDSQECANCSNSQFLFNCRSCRSCFGCTNLRQAEYCIFNKRHTKEEYEAFMQGIHLASFKEREEWRAKCTAFWQSQPRPHAVISMSENVSGNYLFQCKNVKDSFFARNAEDLRYCSLAVDNVKSCYDFSTYGDQVELAYESARCGNRFFRCGFCYYCYDGCADLWYCSYCVGCQDCFGCVGLRKKQYCIFNKQYTKAEYDALVPMIVAHMQTTGEWGRFFPIESSPNPYNHTFAQRYFPMTKEQVLKAGLVWEDDEFTDRTDAIQANDLPDTATATAKPFVVKSAVSGKHFSITTQEIRHSAMLKAPLPRTTYAEGMEDRASRLGGMMLYERTCAKTGKPI